MTLDQINSFIAAACGATVLLNIAIVAYLLRRATKHQEDRARIQMIALQKMVNRLDERLDNIAQKPAPAPKVAAPKSRPFSARIDDAIDLAKTGMPAEKIAEKTSLSLMDTNAIVRFHYAKVAATPLAS